MAVVTIPRTPWIDDDGSGTYGTVINNAEKTLLYNQIDAALAQLLPLTGGANVSISGDYTEKGRAGSMGQVNTVPYNAANFTANVGAWTVAAGNVQAYQYSLVGRWATIIVSIAGASIAGSPSSLGITLPPGMNVSAMAQCPCSVFDTAAAYAGMCRATAGQISIYKDLSGAGTFANSTNGFHLGIVISVPVSGV